MKKFGLFLGFLAAVPVTSAYAQTNGSWPIAVPVRAGNIIVGETGIRQSKAFDDTVTAVVINPSGL